MRARGKGYAGLGVLLALVPGCSVIVGGRIETPQCSDDSQCEVLNERDHIGPDACARWQCVPGRPEGTVCAFRQERDDDDDGDPGCGTGTDCNDHDPTVYAHGVGALAGAGDAGAGDAGVVGCGSPSGVGPAPECYDGKDNDCNAVVDEGAGTVVPVAPASVAVSASGNAVNYSEGRAGELAALFSHGPGSAGEYGADLLDFRGAAADPSSPVGYQSVRNAGPEVGCYVDTGSGPVLNACDFADVALDELPGAPNTFFAATVNRKPCTKGQVRVGYLARDTAGTALVIRGPETASDVFLGVDSAGGTTGCSSDGAGAEGASALALASLPASGGFDPEALAVWVARDFDAASACPAAPAPVRALGLDYAAGGPRVVATNGGNAQTVGTTTGSARPAVAPVSETDSYLLGFAARAGAQPQVELHLLPRVNRESDATQLDLSAAPLAIPASADADDVALGPAPQVGGTYPVGVAWRAGCGTNSSVWFALARVDLRARTVTASEPLQLSLGGAASEPTLLYLSGGLLAPGRTYAGSTVTTGNAGGWVVVWVRADGATRHLVARRVAQLDGRPVDAVEIDLGPSGTADADVAAPRLYPAPASAAHLARLAYWDRAHDTLVGTEIFLPTAP